MFKSDIEKKIKVMEFAVNISDDLRKIKERLPHLSIINNFYKETGSDDAITSAMLEYSYKGTGSAFSQKSSMIEQSGSGLFRVDVFSQYIDTLIGLNNKISIPEKVADDADDVWDFIGEDFCYNEFVEVYSGDQSKAIALLEIMVLKAVSHLSLKSDPIYVYLAILIRALEVGNSNLFNFDIEYID